MQTKSNVYSRRKSGRAFNGAHRDAGWITHAVPNEDSHFSYETALCGTSPGVRSNGWGYIEKFPITCKKCLDKIDRNPNFDIVGVDASI